jgi:hydroxyethylthiazole kinase-like uncharacterized protein yjeF
MKLITVDQIRAIEKEADAHGLSYRQMMLNAGHGLAQSILIRFEDGENKTALGLVGSGNNGGDTLVALTELIQHGWQAVACLVKSRPKDDEWLNDFQRQGGIVINASQNTDFKEVEDALKKSMVLLDGVIGIGFRLPMEAPVGDFLRRVAAFPTRPFTIAVNCPSGVDCASGEAAVECIPADLTVCMAAVKTGLLRFPAFQFVGELETVDIGLPHDLQAWSGIRDQVADPEMVAGWLPTRPLNAHKGSFGTAMLAAGSRAYTGAVLLAGRAAYRMGIGLLRIAIPASIHSTLAGHLPEATWLLLPELDGNISAEAAPILKNNLEKVNALLLGPGWGTGESTLQFLQQLLKTEQLPPLVVDADGLRLLAKIPDWDKHLPRGSVLTPHPGEMSALTSLEVNVIQQDRLEIARKYALQWGQVVVLKGALTVIASPQGYVVVVPVATPALARAGTGDVLAGMLTSLLAQGMDSFQTAVCASWVHARAGLLVAQWLGSAVSVLASDVIESIPQVLASLE